MKKSKIAYIEPRDDGKPCMTLAMLLSDVESYGLDIRGIPGVTPHSGKGRRKVQITVTVEAVE